MSLYFLLRDLLLVAVFAVGVIFGFKVRSGNNAAALLTIVGWGIALCNGVILLIWHIPFGEFLNFGIFEGLPEMLRSAEVVTGPMATGCVLLGILRLASSDTNFGNTRSSSTRYKPLDLYATGDR
jgi:hypothetical protein